MRRGALSPAGRLPGSSREGHEGQWGLVLGVLWVEAVWVIDLEQQAQGTVRGARAKGGVWGWSLSQGGAKAAPPRVQLGHQAPQE